MDPLILRIHNLFHQLQPLYSTSTTMPPKKTGNPKQKKEPSIAQNKTKPKPRKQVVKGNLHPTEGLTCEACGGVLPVWIIRTDGIGGGDLSLYKPAGFAGAPKLFLLCLRCKCIGNDCPELAERALPGAVSHSSPVFFFPHLSLSLMNEPDLTVLINISGHRKESLVRIPS